MEEIKPQEIPEEVWVTEDGMTLLQYIVIGLSAFAVIDLILMATIFLMRGELPDIFGTLATIVLGAVAGVLGGAYATRSNS